MMDITNIYKNKAKFRKTKPGLQEMIRNCYQNAMNLVECEENLEVLKKKLHLQSHSQTPERMLKSLSLIIEHSLKAKREAE